MKKLLLFITLFTLVLTAEAQVPFTPPFTRQHRKAVDDSLEIRKLLQVDSTSKVRIWTDVYLVGKRLYIVNGTDTAYIEIDVDGRLNFKDMFDTATLADLLAGGGGGGSDSLTGSGTVKSLARWTGQYTLGNALGLVQENDGSIGLTASNPTITLGSTVGALGTGSITVSYDGDLTFFDSNLGVTKTLTQLAQDMPTGDQVMDSLNEASRTVLQKWTFEDSIWLQSVARIASTLQLGVAADLTGDIKFYHAASAFYTSLFTAGQTANRGITIPILTSDVTLPVGALAPINVNASTGIITADTTTANIGLAPRAFVTNSLAGKVTLQGTTPGTPQTGNINISGKVISGTSETSSDALVGGNLTVTGDIQGTLNTTGRQHVLRANTVDQPVLKVLGAQFGNDDIIQAGSYAANDTLFSVQDDGSVYSKGGATFGKLLQFQNANHLGLVINSLSTADRNAAPPIAAAVWYNYEVQRPEMWTNVQIERFFTLNDYNDSLRAAQIVFGAGLGEYLWLATVDSAAGGGLKDSSNQTIGLKPLWIRGNTTFGDTVLFLGRYDVNVGAVTPSRPPHVIVSQIDDNTRTVTFGYGGSGGATWDFLGDLNVNGSPIGGGSGHVIRDSTTTFTQQPYLQFLGNLVEVSDVGADTTRVVISGTYHDTSAAGGDGTMLQSSADKQTVSNVVAKAVRLNNSASDATLTTAGDVHINTTDEQFSFHSAADGEISGEASVPLLFTRSWPFDPKAVCDGTIDRLFLEKLMDEAPEGIIIDEWFISFEADPTTELDADLKYADAMIGVANAAVVDALDTTNGVATEDTDANINGGAAVPAGKVVYIEFITPYSETGHQIMFTMTWHYLEN